jgi:hypothetical protein
MLHFILQVSPLACFLTFARQNVMQRLAMIKPKLNKSLFTGRKGYHRPFYFDKRKNAGCRQRID